jgi:excisionase family DNA binding protein
VGKSENQQKGTEMKSTGKPNVTSPWYTINEASAYLKCSVKTLRNLVKDGRIAFRRINPETRGKFIFRQEWLDAYMMGYEDKVNKYMSAVKRGDIRPVKLIA